MSKWYDLICQNCGCDFKTVHNKQKCCSRACAGIVYSQKMRGKSWPKRGGSIEKICKQCQKIFVSFKAHHRLFCSNECRFAWLKVNPIRYWLGKKRPEVKTFFTMKGKHLTEAHKKWLSEKYKGRKISEKQKRQISQTLMGHPANMGSGRGRGGYRKDIGFYARSTWEANVARSFLCEELEYVYEPTRLRGKGFTYCPDFYLPELDCFVEVKGYIDKIARQKLQLFNKYHLDYLLITKPEYDQLKQIYGGIIKNWE